MSNCFRNTWVQLSMRRCLALAAITLLACGEATGPTAWPLDPPVGLFVSPSRLSLTVGGVGRLTARAYGAAGQTTNASVKWSSLDPAIATVDKSDGIVTAISAGTTTVTANAGTLRATATVSVLGPPVGLSISRSELSLLVRGVERLTARAYDAAGQTINSSFEWSSADPGTVSVGRSDGILAAVAAGTTAVTVSVAALRATAIVSVIDVIGTISFTRTSYDHGSYTFDVLSYANRAIRSLARPTQYASIAAPAWSPEGTLLAVEVIRDQFVDDVEHWSDYASDLYVLPAAAPLDSPWRALTVDGGSRSPSWSPDGARLAFVRRPMLSDSGHIYLIDGGGGEPRLLTVTAGAYGTPRWSPDGTRLTFSDGRLGNGDIFVINADGSGLTNLTQSPVSEWEPSWSPDGARLVFVSDRHSGPGDYHRDVFVVDVDGKNLRRLTSSGWSSGPVWSPDGLQICFSLGGENQGIHVMNADGSALVRLTTPPPNSWDSAPAWRR